VRPCRGGGKALPFPSLPSLSLCFPCLLASFVWFFSPFCRSSCPFAAFQHFALPTVHPAILSVVHPAVQPAIHPTHLVVICFQSASSPSLSLSSPPPSCSSPSSPPPSCPSPSSLSLLVVDLVCGVLDRVFSTPDLFSHVISASNRALPSSSPASQLPFSASRSLILSPLASTRYVLRRRRPYLFFAFCFVVVVSYVVAFVSLYFLCVCSLLVFTMYYLRGETSFLALFWFFLLVLLLSVAMVVLSGFSFADVVISFSNSKTFQSFHAAITCLSYSATSGEGRAAFLAKDEACSFVVLFWFGICLCNALYCAHVVRWAASPKVFGEAFPTLM
jgi:hypothetical protein